MDDWNTFLVMIGGLSPKIAKPGILGIGSRGVWRIDVGVQQESKKNKNIMLKNKCDG